MAASRAGWGWHWVVTTPAARYELRSGLLRSRCEFSRDGRLIHSAERVGLVRDKFSLDLPPDVPLCLTTPPIGEEHLDLPPAIFHDGYR